MSDSEEDNACTHLKIVLIGNSKVGKTSIINRYIQNQFYINYEQTLGIDFFHKRIVLPGECYTSLKIHDIGGTTLGGPMFPSYLSGASGILFVYDITNPESFHSLEDWFCEVDKLFSDTKRPHFALVANKIDMEHLREVSLDRQRMFAETRDMSWHSLSAKNGDCVDLCFKRIACKITGIRLPKVSQTPTAVKADVVQYNKIEPATAMSHTSICLLQ